MKRILPLLLILILNYPLIAQVDLNVIIQEESSDIKIEGLSLPIHKIALYDTLLWASDYGNGGVYKSIDGGETFKEIAKLGAEYFESIQFLNEKVGFISGDYGYVYKTIDGGSTWTEISPEIENRITERFRNDSTKNQEPDGIFAAYYSMYFMSESRGYVSGFSFNPSLGFGKSFERLFFLTSNGGLSWRLLDQSEQKGAVNEFKGK
ncbi:WD40/YVTN/BNR-like repeat-containing protein, partial [Fulvivirga lutimaris]|uniref:WD40/YVTN/BNR-like repeat-containing protein n=1 Tax=Fulvivirga lutimaris TaxID=1819566 RepID=UPI003CCD90F1|nr:hypothetical protein [Fulvivirga lutimaris]